MSAAAITFPIQHWVIRTVEVAGHEEDVWATTLAIWKLSTLAAIRAFAGTYAVGPRLFTVPSSSFPLMAALLPIGSVVMEIHRGLLATRATLRSGRRSSRSTGCPAAHPILPRRGTWRTSHGN